MATIIKGRVTWWNASKGYGFISREGGPDVFVHISVVQSSGMQSLEEGQLVEFTVEAGPKGVQVSRIYLSGLSGDITTDAPPPRIK